MKYPRPTTDEQHVLLTAIRKGYVDCIVIPTPGFRTRVSKLKLVDKVQFTPERVKMINRNKHLMVITRHHLRTKAAKLHALEVFKKLTKKNVA